MYRQTITSLQHPIVKHLVALRQKREYRAECKTALLSGINSIRDMAASCRFKTVVIEQDYEPDFVFESERTYICTKAIMKKITAVSEPQPLVAEIQIPEEEAMEDKNLLLILDSISDPGNMGSLLRTALALGWHGVFLTPNCSDPFNEKALRAAKGATFKIPLKTGSWQELDALLNARRGDFFAADSRGEPLKSVHAKAPLALALGNEAKGLSPEIAARAIKLAIPMHEAMESLNVAVAGAILMYHLNSTL
jgi:RNA methyltransferase, TrmH family